MPRRFWDESGQALVLSALAIGLVLVVLAFAVVGAAILVSARAALAKGADAAALAALKQSSVGATLQVSYVEYTCRWMQRFRTLACSGSSPGQTRESVTGAAFATGPTGMFGPLPGWAASAGCVGTVWPGTVGSAGVYRICTRQQVASAGLSDPSRTRMEHAAQEWLQANVQMDGPLNGATVTGVTVGQDGQVTVSATAGVRPGLLMFRQVSVAETAWPGQLG